jgi:hypothetical protein
MIESKEIYDLAQYETVEIINCKKRIDEERLIYPAINICKLNFL